MGKRVIAVLVALGLLAIAPAIVNWVMERNAEVASVGWSPLHRDSVTYAVAAPAAGAAGGSYEYTEDDELILIVNDVGEIEHLWIPCPTLPHGFRVEMEVRLEAGAPGVAGIMLGTADKHYLFHVDGHGRTSVVRRRHGTWETIYDWRPFTAPTSPYALMLEVDGTRVRFYMNDMLLFRGIMTITTPAGLAVHAGTLGNAPVDAGFAGIEVRDWAPRAAALNPPVGTDDDDTVLTYDGRCDILTIGPNCEFFTVSGKSCPLTSHCHTLDGCLLTQDPGCETYDCHIITHDKSCWQTLDCR